MAAVEMRAMLSFTYPCHATQPAGNRQTNGAKALIVCMRVWASSPLNIEIVKLKVVSSFQLART